MIYQTIVKRIETRLAPVYVEAESIEEANRIIEEYKNTNMKELHDRLDFQKRFDTQTKIEKITDDTQKSEKMVFGEFFEFKLPIEDEEAK